MAEDGGIAREGAEARSDGFSEWGMRNAEWGRRLRRLELGSARASGS
jgi:hypothetical protein